MGLCQEIKCGQYKPNAPGWMRCGCPVRASDMQRIAELKEALNFAYNTIMHRDGIKFRMDLFTNDERERLRKAIEGER